MAPGRQVILDYRAALGKNQDIFLLNHPYAFHAFGGLNDCFLQLGQRLQTGRDKNRKTYVSFIPFLLPMQRQALSAFQALSSHQSYQAWVLLRPCLESALIMGKWVDNRKNVDIWKNRASDPKAYRQAYSGKALRSAALPRAGDIQSVLSRINDDFMHLNRAYYSRHTEMRPAGESAHHLLVQYFDDDVDHQAHTYAFLHLMAVVLESMSGLLDGLFGPAAADCGLRELEDLLRPGIAALAGEHPDRNSILVELGLWSLT